MGYSHDAIFSCSPATTATVTVTATITAEALPGSPDIGLLVALFKQFLTLLERLFDILTETIDNGLQKTWINRGMFGLAVIMGVLGALQLFKDIRYSNRRLTSLEHQLQALQRLPGPQGPAGVNGLQGIQGPAGVSGSPGAAGSTGQNGFNGIRGRDGSPGRQGPRGPRGLRGLQGLQGRRGRRGLSGASGVSISHERHG